MSNSKCDTGMFPITTFIILNKDGETNISKIKGACSTKFNASSTLHLFDYYNGNYKKIESEYIMPIIFSAEIYKDKSMSYSMSSIDHEPSYSFYFKIGNYQESLHFAESYIENNKSLFHEYN